MKMSKAKRMLKAGDCADDKDINWVNPGEAKDSLRKIIHEQRLNKMTNSELMAWLNGGFK